MTLWIYWWGIVWELRPACSRLRTFLWMAVCLAGISIREDLMGVTSIVRVLGLKPECYTRLLDCFHSSALNTERLTQLWTALLLKLPLPLVHFNGRIVLVGDGLKVPKSGRRMPAVKCLHQESSGNTKPDYIMGHSCQVVALLVQALGSVLAIPLAARIHEGLVSSNRDQRTLLDKMAALLQSLAVARPFYFVADAYYASGRFICELLEQGQHLVTRVRITATAYFLPEECVGTKGRGRPKQYGRKIKLRSLFDADNLQTVDSPIYNEKGVQLQFYVIDLLWRPVGSIVRFVAVVHPIRGRILLLCTDLSLSPVEIIQLYGLRFKIEVSFKQALRTLGAYTYHFWMASMTPLHRNAGNQYLHRKSPKYRQAVRRKFDAYQRHIQLGIIAQGILHFLAIAHTNDVWNAFGSWLRTIRSHTPPSEFVTAMALRQSWPHFLMACVPGHTLTKFVLDRMDFSRVNPLRLAG